MEWERVADRQLGVVTLDQLRRAGITPRELRTLEAHGRLVRRHPSVFSVNGSPTTLPQQRLAAGLAVPSCAVSHRAAAAILGSERMRNALPEVLVPYSGTHRLGGVVVHRSRSIEPADIVRIDPFPRVTRAARTLLDLARTDMEDETLFEVGSDLLVAFPREIPRLRTVRSQRIRRLFGQYIQDGRRPPHPGLERRLLALIAADDRIPPPTVHLTLATADGTIEVDLAWPDVRLAIEADSLRWHSNARQFGHDRARDQALAAIGWLVVRFTADQIERSPRRVADRIVAIRKQRSQ